MPVVSAGVDTVIRQAAMAGAAHDFRRRIAIVLGAGMLLLVVLIGLSIYLFERNRDYSAWVDHTYQAEAKISELGTVLERVETARRGYLLEPRPGYWNTYIEGRFALPAKLEDLARFTSDNPRQARNIADVRELLRDKYAQLARSIELAKAGHPAEAHANFLKDQDSEITRRLRGKLAVMLAEERGLLQQRAKREANNSLELLSASVAAATLLALVALGSFFLMRRYANDLDVSQRALQAVNEGLEDAVKARTVELTRANEEIQRFAYIVSHDLRSPLVNVMGFTAELETAIKPLSELIAKVDAEHPGLVQKEAREAVTLDLPESVGFIRSSTQKMDRLINAILRLSREGRRNLLPEQLDMDGLATGVAATLKVLADGKGAHISIDGVLPNIESDRVAIEQVLANLMENAVKYLKPGRPGVITVSGRPVGDRVVYEVADNGRGIAAADQQRVFDLFRRAGVQDQPGEGIGLAHVRALVYRLGGLIDCSSEIDKGATFRVFLPRHLTNEPQKTA